MGTTYGAFYTLGSIYFHIIQKVSMKRRPKGDSNVRLLRRARKALTKFVGLAPMAHWQLPKAYFMLVRIIATDDGRQSQPQEFAAKKPQLVKQVLELVEKGYNAQKALALWKHNNHKLERDLWEIDCWAIVKAYWQVGLIDHLPHPSHRCANEDCAYVVISEKESLKS